MTTTRTAAGAQGAKPANQKIDNSKLEVAPNGKIESNEKAKEELPKVPTVEDVVKRVEFLQAKIAARETIARHIDQVEKLKFGEFEEKDALIIQSGKGESYTIKSPLLLTQVKAILIDSLEKQKAVIEAEINF